MTVIFLIMVTIIVRYKVILGKEEQFNIWYAEMQHIVEPFPGFISKEFFPPNQENGHVTTILRFDNLINANKWMHSKQRSDMLEKASSEILIDIEEGTHTRNIFWFNTRSGVKKKWKQVLVTFVAIFPLSLIIPRFVGGVIVPLLSNHWLLKSAISVLVLVVLMVFIVMPFMIRVTQKWLE